MFFNYLFVLALTAVYSFIILKMEGETQDSIIFGLRLQEDQTPPRRSFFEKIRFQFGENTVILLKQWTNLRLDLSTKYKLNL